MGRGGERPSELVSVLRRSSKRGSSATQGKLRIVNYIYPLGPWFRMCVILGSLTILFFPFERLLSAGPVAVR